MLRRLSQWASNQSRKSWWILPLQPILTLTVLAAGIVAVWPGRGFSNFHDQLGSIAGHTWLVLGIVAPLLTLWSYWLILRRSGSQRYRGFWLRLGGDVGQFVVLAVFTMLHLSGSQSDEDLYVAVCYGGALVALLMMVVRDVWELVLTEQLAGRIHRDRNHE